MQADSDHWNDGIWRNRHLPFDRARAARYRRHRVVLARKRALALLTRMSMPPKIFAVFAMAASISFSRRMSMAIGPARPPPATISSATVWIVPGSLGLGSSVFEAMAMLAPSAAARSAMSRPLPRLAPVMNRVLPE